MSSYEQYIPTLESCNRKNLRLGRQTGQGHVHPHRLSHRIVVGKNEKTTIGSVRGVPRKGHPYRDIATKIGGCNSRSLKRA